MPSSRTKPRMMFFALSPVAGLEDRDDDGEEDAGHGGSTGRDGDRHVESAPVNPSSRCGDRGAAAADDRGE